MIRIDMGMEINNHEDIIAVSRQRARQK